jgi:hypothetical protein
MYIRALSITNPAIPTIGMSAKASIIVMLPRRSPAKRNSLTEHQRLAHLTARMMVTFRHFTVPTWNRRLNQILESMVNLTFAHPWRQKASINHWTGIDVKNYT